MGWVGCYSNCVVGCVSAVIFDRDEDVRDGDVSYCDCDCCWWL